MNLRLISSVFLSCFIALTACAQMGDKSKRESPPAVAEANVNGASITIEYSQPSVKEREIFGGLVPYGKVWRTGANEATVFTTTEDLMINGQKLPAGKYALFTIPNEGEWTIIFNSESDQWGAYKYDEKKDVLRIKAAPKSHDMTETMLFTVTKDGQVHLDWDETRVSFTAQPA